MRRLALLLLFATACTSTQAPQPAPAETRPARSGAVPIAPRGVSCNSAVVIDAASDSEKTAKEDAWIAENYPGAKVAKRSRVKCNDKPADVIEIDTENGRTRSVYFSTKP